MAPRVLTAFEALHCCPACQADPPASLEVVFPSITDRLAPRGCAHFPTMLSFHHAGLHSVSGEPLLLKNISADTAGYYICTSSNDVGTEFCNITVAPRPRKSRVGREGYKVQRWLFEAIGGRPGGSCDPREMTLGLGFSHPKASPAPLVLWK